jgi:UDP-glucose:(heptosyl)LPS alpha-1,3-glucosyltransferase
MKVALVVHDVGKQRGHDRYVSELAHALADRHEVHIFAGTCRDVDLSRIVFHRVPALRWPDMLKMISFLCAATWMIRRHTFDIVHIQGPSSLVCNVATAHFCQARWQEVYDTLEQGETTRLQRGYHRLVMVTMRALERYLYRSERTRRLVALSHQVKRDLVRFYGCRADKITVIHNGINLDEFHPDNISRYRTALRTESGIAPDAFVMLFVGDFQRKGLQYAIEALAHLGTSKALLIAAGDAPSRPYRELARRLGVQDGVRFVGQRPDIHRYYAMSDALIFPTLYEPFGFIITEAMATGIPVVTSADAGAAELIRDGQDGLLLSDPRDARAIARQIQRLIDDAGLRAALGRNARKRVESLDWSLFAGQVEEVYAAILKGDGHARA